MVVMTALCRGKSTGGRVVRGGSWNNNIDNARCAIRNRNNPDNSNNNVGCWVVAHIFRAPTSNALGLHRRRPRSKNGVT